MNNCAQSTELRYNGAARSPTQLQETHCKYKELIGCLTVQP